MYEKRKMKTDIDRERERERERERRTVMWNVFNRKNEIDLLLHWLGI